jgi:NAD-dependent dihydropyrimidine dehydrogenase PreA subunit
MKRKSHWLRSLILAGVLILLTIRVYLHTYLGGAKAPSVHGLCPFAGLESLHYFFANGTYIAKVFSGTMFLFAVTVIMAIIFRRSFCGMICPLGTIQEFFAFLGRKLFKKRFVIPAGIDRWLRYIKYLTLILTIYMAWWTASLWMSPYDPWVAYAHLPEGLAAVWEESAVGLILLAVAVIGSMLYDRFFCKYLCPVGALYAIIGKISPYRVSRTPESCRNCGLCNRVCPVNLNVMSMVEITSAECLNCQICVNNCPVKGTLQAKWVKWRIKPVLAVLLPVGLFFGLVIGGNLTRALQYNPAPLPAGTIISLGEVKGNMSIADAVAATGLEEEDFYTKMQIPLEVKKSTLMKDIPEQVPGYDFDAVKSVYGGDAHAEPDTDVLPSEIDTDSNKNTSSAKTDYAAVKGSLTIKEAAEVSGVSLKVFYADFDIPEKVPSTVKMKDIGGLVEGYDFGDIKETWSTQ